MVHHSSIVEFVDFLNCGSIEEYPHIPEPTHTGTDIFYCRIAWSENRGDGAGLAWAQVKVRQLADRAIAMGEEVHSSK